MLTITGHWLHMEPGRDRAWALTMFVMGTVSTLQRDRVTKWLTRRRGGIALASPAKHRRRVGLDHVILVLGLAVLVGLLVLGSVLMLLARVTATLPPSTLRSTPCAEFDFCVTPVADRDEATSVDDLSLDGLTLTR